MREQAPRSGVQRAVPAQITDGAEAVARRDGGGRRGLSQDLRILEVEATAEREPAGRQGEARAGADLGRVRRGPERGRGLGGEPIGPDEREPERDRSRLRVRADGRRPRPLFPLPQQRPRRRDPYDVPDDALDALGGEIREGAPEVEEERRTRAPGGPGTVRTTRGQDDQFTHRTVNDRARENSRKSSRIGQRIGRTA